MYNSPINAADPGGSTGIIVGRARTLMIRPKPRWATRSATSPTVTTWEQSIPAMIAESGSRSEDVVIARCTRQAQEVVHRESQRPCCPHDKPRTNLVCSVRRLPHQLHEPRLGPGKETARRARTAGY